MAEMQGKIKPLTRTEAKILVYNKMKQGYTYSEACKMVREESEFMKKNARAQEEKPKTSFKEGFEQLTGKKHEDK